MRLINTTTLELEDFSSKPKPPYAILSHRWTEPEITYTDICSGNISGKLGFAKIQGTAQQALRDGLQYVWIDTCAIDKQSSSELSEAINSMFSWYKNSERCYVYLCDVDEQGGMESFRDSEWFTRGWTLQELLAPKRCLFFDRNWQFLGDRKTLEKEISKATGIPHIATNWGFIDNYTVAEKMSWAAKRRTTRVEDMAYCLMGLFDVNMPLLYGEGEKAFMRLQEEVIKNKDDHTIFAWSMGDTRFSGLLAPSPICFTECGTLIQRPSSGGSQPFSMTNRGLSIKLKITPWSADTYLALLECSKVTVASIRTGGYEVCIFLRRLAEDDQYARIAYETDGLFLDTDFWFHSDKRPIMERQLFIRKQIDLGGRSICSLKPTYGYETPYSWLPPTATIQNRGQQLVEKCTVLPPGRWGQVLAIDVSAELKGLKYIILGFDFDFNPIVVLVDSFVDRNEFHIKQRNYLDWSVKFPDELDWYEIERDRVYRRKDHNGVWALRGHRIYGLYVTLSESPSHKGQLVNVYRDEKVYPFVWKAYVEGLDGVFASPTPRI